MVSAGAQRHRAGRAEAGEEGFDLPDHLVEMVDAVESHIPDVGDPAQRKGIDPRQHVDPADYVRPVANLARPVARTGLEGHAVVCRHADERDVEALERRGERCAQERGSAHEAQVVERPVGLARYG